MQGARDGRSTGREQQSAQVWMQGKNGKPRRNNAISVGDMPIPKPTTELGFTGITHKISGTSRSGLQHQNQ